MAPLPMASLAKRFTPQKALIIKSLIGQGELTDTIVPVWRHSTGPLFNDAGMEVDELGAITRLPSSLSIRTSLLWPKISRLVACPTGDERC
ncbi:hypothetical protein D3C76_646450 [compost metagenome]